MIRSAAYYVLEWLATSDDPFVAVEKHEKALRISSPGYVGFFQFLQLNTYTLRTA